MYDEHGSLLASPELAAAIGAVAQPQELNGQRYTVVKTHNLPIDYHADISRMRGLYIVRDGREACVSYHRWRNHNQATKGGPVLAMSQTIGEHRPDGTDDSWSAHLDAWKPREREGLLCLRYEDLTQTYRGVRETQLQRMEEFLGMSRVSDTWPGIDELRPLDQAFFHSGPRLTWPDELTGDDLALFYKLHGATMDEYGYRER